MTTRRNFLRQTTGALLSAGLETGRCAGVAALEPGKLSAIRRLKNPVAIAMWDFSWLLRQHPGGGFENYDRALDELAERGYNAVRIDVFPHLVGLAGREGVPERFKFDGRGGGRHALWGNDVDVTVDPRAALLEFIPKCRKRGIHVEASTWFMGPKGTSDRVRSFEDFVAVWSETLDFMERNDLLRDVLFVDLLNEYPQWNGFAWLREAAQAAAETHAPGGPTPKGDEHVQDNKRRAVTDAHRAFYRQFSTRLLRHFRGQRPRYDFAISLSPNWDGFQNERSVDMNAMDVLDLHIWFGHRAPIGQYDMAKAQEMNPDELRQRYGRLKKAWADNRAMLIQWMDERLALHAQWGRAANAVVGNTEGWGSVGWDDTAPLDWEFIKETAGVCVDLALKHGQRFVCTSNFTHPHFKRLWADVAWHQAITAKIRNA